VVVIASPTNCPSARKAGQPALFPSNRTGEESPHQAPKMGASMSWLSGLVWSKKEVRILILGLVRIRLPSRLPTQAPLARVDLYKG
jgi:hypothetical protein